MIIKPIVRCSASMALRVEISASRARFASSTKSLRTDEEFQKELEKKKKLEEKETRQSILAEYEQRRAIKIKRYSRALPFYNVDTEFVFKDLLNYPLLSPDAVTNDSSDFERHSLTMYKKSEQDALQKHILIAKHPERTSLTVEAKTPSVSNIIEIAQPLPTALFEWQFQKMRVLGSDGFYKYKMDSLRTGSVFHKFLADRLRAKRNAKNGIVDEKIDLAEYEGLIDLKRLTKLNEVLQRIGQVLLIETDCVHQNLFYLGRIDCLAYLDGDLYLIDWKLNESRKENIRDLYDTPIQIAAYLGAYLNDPKHKKLRQEHKIKGGLFVNICKTSGEVDLHFINYQLAEYFWYKWLAYVRKFWMIVIKNK